MLQYVSYMLYDMMQLSNDGILQVSERAQVEKRVWNLSLDIVEAQIP